MSFRAATVGERTFSLFAAKPLPYGRGSEARSRASVGQSVSPASWLLAAVCCALPAFGAIDGVVTNQTTGASQVGAVVALYKLGGAGMEAAGQTKTGAGGAFSLNQQLEPGPYLLQSVWEGVTYNHMLPPGSATTGLKLDVYNAARKQPAGAKISQHMILFEPGDGRLAISETYILANSGKVTWNDPDGGTLQFYLPKEANGAVQVQCTAPQGMPVRRAAEKTGRGDTYKLDFAVKPGETRIDLNYAVPYSGGTYQGKLVMPAEATRLVVPAGVTLTGEHLTAMGPEPQSQANIYDLKGSTYAVKIEGSGALRAAQGGAASGGEAAGGGEQESSGPSFEQIPARIMGNAPLIVAIALGILALGFVLLYRSDSEIGAARETNERRRG